MIEQQERTLVPMSEVPQQETVIVDRQPETIPPVESNGAAAEAAGNRGDAPGRGGKAPFASTNSSARAGCTSRSAD